MTRITMTIIASLIASLAACTTPNDPALLDHAQILAVRAEPAHVVAGGSVRIDALIGTTTGEVAVVVPDEVAVAGMAAERRSDGWYITSPGDAPSAPLAAIAVAIDGSMWRATKQLVFDDDRANPAIAAMQVDGVAASTIEVVSGTEPTLGASADGDPASLDYAWYTSIGTLDHYRSPAATLTADEPGLGTVVVIVRDRAGGVAWQTIAVDVR
jgi:hypothetical protein